MKFGTSLVKSLLYICRLLRKLYRFFILPYDLFCLRFVGAVYVGVKRAYMTVLLLFAVVMC